MIRDPVEQGELAPEQAFGALEQIVDLAFRRSPVLHFVSRCKASLLGAIVGRFVHHMESLFRGHIRERTQRDGLGLRH